MLINEIKWDYVKSPDGIRYPVVEILASESTKHAFKGGAEWYPYFGGDEKDLCAMVAVHFGDRLDVVVTDGDCLGICAEALSNGQDYKKAIAEAGHSLTENAGFTFEDADNYHFVDSKYNRLQDLAVMSVGMLLQLGWDNKDSYLARRFQIEHSQRDLDAVDIKKTWLEGDKRDFEFEKEYWLDQFDSPKTYYFAVTYSYDNELMEEISRYLFSDINMAFAYADSTWENMSSEEKSQFCSFKLSVIEMEDNSGEYYKRVMHVVKDYVRLGKGESASGKYIVQDDKFEEFVIARRGYLPMQ